MEERVRTIENELGIEEERVRAVYLFGSRVWATQQSDSDFDFLFVVDGWSGQGGDISIGDDLNANVVSTERFEQLLRQADVNYAMFLFFPKEFVLKGDDVDWNRGRALGSWDRLDLFRLKRSAVRELSRTEGKSHLVGTARGAVKCLIHGLRFCNFVSFMMRFTSGRQRERFSKEQLEIKSELFFDFVEWSANERWDLIRPKYQEQKLESLQCIRDIFNEFESRLAQVFDFWFLLIEFSLRNSLAMQSSS
jgi:hypothetical protein